jgi:acetyl-CoA carboxylase biotin carboxyl carrier protein
MKKNTKILIIVCAAALILAGLMCLLIFLPKGDGSSSGAATYDEGVKMSVTTDKDGVHQAQIQTNDKGEIDNNSYGTLMDYIPAKISKIHLEKEHPAQQIFNASPIGAYQPTATDVPAPAPVQPQAPAAQSAAPEEDAKTVNAPIVGVFYAASAPGKAPFAPVGKKVSKGSTVCIIEAMKCMNEIQAEDDYEIVEVLVKDGDLVEYGQPLFKVK